MPGLDELEFREYADFTGGLWQHDNDRICPPNGLLECMDCFPLSEGGLQAFAQFTPLPKAGLPTTDAVIIGVWANFLSNGLYAMSLEFNTGAGTHTFRVHTNTAGSSSRWTDWVTIFTRTDVTALGSAIRMDSFRSSAGYQNYFNFPVTISAGSTDGIWNVPNGSTVGFSFAVSSPLGLWTHQSRLMTIGLAQVIGAGLLHSDILYTDAGISTALSTANVLSPLGEHMAPLQFLLPSEPSDLLGYKADYGLLDVQGDITAPTVRQVGFDSDMCFSFGINTPIGPVLCLFSKGMVVWDGQSLQSISKAIQGAPMKGAPLTQANGTEFLGTLSYSQQLQLAPAFAGNWLLAGNGYVMDLQSGAWFTVSSIAGNARYWAATAYDGALSPSRFNERMYVSNDVNALTGKPQVYESAVSEADWTPMHTYSYTIPLIESPGQKTTVREIEWDLTTFNDSSELTVEITDDTATTTLGPFSLADTAPDNLRITVPLHPSKWVKVRTILTSNRPGTGAPTLARMRVGVQAATRNAVSRA